LSESLEQFRGAVVATSDGKFTFQIFTVCSEPQTLLTDSPRYMTPADAAQAGYQAIVALRKGSAPPPALFKAQRIYARPRRRGGKRSEV
jgi:hypothetical protein